MRGVDQRATARSALDPSPRCCNQNSEDPTWPIDTPSNGRSPKIPRCWIVITIVNGNNISALSCIRLIRSFGLHGHIIKVVCAVRQTSKQTASANPKPADDPVTIRDYSAFNLTADRFICHMEYVEVHAPFESPAGAPKLLPDRTNSGVTVWISATFHCTVRTLRLSLTRILTVTSSCPDGSLGSQLQLRRGASDETEV
jgi:hypothetical protein